jgi:hypothetical protein
LEFADRRTSRAPGAKPLGAEWGNVSRVAGIDGNGTRLIISADVTGPHLIGRRMPIAASA